MNTTMTYGQSFTLAIEADDASVPPVKQPIPVGATVTFTSNNPTAVQITPNADGVTAVAKAMVTSPAVGSAAISATLTWTDVAGSHSYTTPIDAVTVGAPASTIVSVKLIAGTPA